jgi:hypothetical protein
VRTDLCLYFFLSLVPVPRTWGRRLSLARADRPAQSAILHLPRLFLLPGTPFPALVGLFYKALLPPLLGREAGGGGRGADVGSVELELTSLSTTLLIPI